MMSLSRKIAISLFAFTCSLQAVDINNLNNCIRDVRQAEVSPPAVPTFDSYTNDYEKLLADLEAASATLPYVYQEAAAKPLIQFLQNLGKSKYLELFDGSPLDEYSSALQQIIPDAALCILYHEEVYDQGVNAFQEIVSDLYDGFISDEVRRGNETGVPIEPPTYGVIPPLVKFGNPEFGPYTWPGDATSQLLGMKCGVVNLPPAQLKGGLIAWSCLGHETGGHDITHADEGLLEELARKVYDAVLKKFGSRQLASYWSKCIDEATADVCGYLNMGPSAGIGLIGYFRALGDGSLRTVGSISDPHPIDLLRGYLAAAVVKRLGFSNAAVWSTIISRETSKDNSTLYLVDDFGNYYWFPVSFNRAVASTDVVAETIMKSPLAALQGHSLQELQDWKDQHQALVDQLALILKTEGNLPENLRSPDFYAAYVIAAATQAALETGSNIPTIFNGMKTFLAMMHAENLTWSIEPTVESLAILEQASKEAKRENVKLTSRVVFPKLPEETVLVGEAN